MTPPITPAGLIAAHALTLAAVSHGHLRSWGLAARRSRPPNATASTTPDRRTTGPDHPTRDRRGRRSRRLLGEPARPAHPLPTPPPADRGSSRQARIPVGRPPAADPALGPRHRPRRTDRRRSRRGLARRHHPHRPRHHTPPQHPCQRQSTRPRGSTVGTSDGRGPRPRSGTLLPDRHRPPERPQARPARRRLPPARHRGRLRPGPRPTRQPPPDRPPARVRCSRRRRTTHESRSPRSRCQVARRHPDGPAQPHAPNCHNRRPEHLCRPHAASRQHGGPGQARRSALGDRPAVRRRPHRCFARRHDADIGPPTAEPTGTA